MTRTMIRSYEEMPLAVYLRLLEMKEQEGTDVAVVALLTGRTEDELRSGPLKEYRRLAAECGFIYYTPEAAPVRGAYQVGGWCLKPTKMDNLTTAQYCDFKEWAKITDRDATAEMLSALLVPDGMKYADGYDVADVIAAIREGMSVTDAAGLRAFYLREWVRSIRASLTYSRRRLPREMTGKQRREARRTAREAASLLSGAGCGMWMRWQSLPAARGARSMG